MSKHLRDDCEGYPDAVEHRLRGITITSKRARQSIVSVLSNDGDSSLEASSTSNTATDDKVHSRNSTIDANQVANICNKEVSTQNPVKNVTHLFDSMSPCSVRVIKTER